MAQSHVFSTKILKGTSLLLINQFIIQHKERKLEQKLKQIGADLIAACRKIVDRRKSAISKNKNEDGERKRSNADSSESRPEWVGKESWEEIILGVATRKWTKDL